MTERDTYVRRLQDIKERAAVAKTAAQYADRRAGMLASASDAVRALVEQELANGE
jgi:hypothetical protein